MYQEPEAVLFVVNAKLFKRDDLGHGCGKMEDTSDLLF